LKNEDACCSGDCRLAKVFGVLATEAGWSLPVLCRRGDGGRLSQWLELLDLEVYAKYIARGLIKILLLLLRP